MIDLRREAVRRDEILQLRLATLVPALLEEAGVDCWLVVGREYAEDPVLRTMLPSTWLSARRRTILVFFRDERFAVARYAVGDLFPGVWDPAAQPDQWAALAELLAERDPQSIAIDVSADFAHGDGLTVGQHRELLAALPAHLAARIIETDGLAVAWLETRLPEERDSFEEACATAHAILRRGLSREGIAPGETTTEDLEWWYRQTVHDAGLTSWFHPTVSVQRPDATNPGSYANRPGPQTIDAGDLVHVDFGIVHGGLCTDQQEHAYVLPPGESGPPEGFVRGFDAARRVQDLLMERFAVGISGNELLRSSLEAASAEGIDATVYSHPIGYHGHGAGPTVGLWDAQDGVPGAGDRRIRANTAWSIELNAAVPVDEWGGAEVRFMLEQDAWFDGERCSFLDGRQEAIWVIG